MYSKFWNVLKIDWKALVDEKRGLFCLKMSQNGKTVMMILVEMHLTHLMTSQMMNKHCFEVIHEMSKFRGLLEPRNLIPLK